MKANNIRVCYFGIYDPTYSRNKILISGLRANGVEVIECNDRSHGWKKYYNLTIKFSSLYDKFDVMVVGYPGFQPMILARLLTRKPIIFDAFYSLYNTAVEDRKSVKSKSILGYYYKFLDYLSCLLASKVIIDTNAHIDYFIKKYHLNRNKFSRIWIGADKDTFNPQTHAENNTNDFFTLEFHGTFIPLQGLEYIVKAINIIKNENIKLYIYGRGQEFEKIQKMINEMQLSDRIILCGNKPVNELSELISFADVSLGIFGDTKKTLMVIPNKVYECVAMKIPVISSDTPAIRELFDENSLMLCNYADANDLAAKIIILKADSDLRKRLAENAYRIYEERLTPSALGHELLSLINDLYVSKK